MDDFTKHYLICALWCSTDDNDQPLDSNYDVDDFAPKAVATAIGDCADFQKANTEMLMKAYSLYPPHPDAPTPQCSAGHDFWLTRNGHGAGFWDRGFGAVGEALTQAAKVYGSCDCYVGDDGKVYLQ